MNKLYIPQPEVWPSDPIGVVALKAVGLCWFVGLLGGFISIWGN